jgi:hypothetical protein
MKRTLFACLLVLGCECSGHHNCSGPCVESAHGVGWFDDGRGYVCRCKGAK